MKVYIVKAHQDTKHLSSVLFPIIFEKETGKRIRHEGLIRDKLGKPRPVGDIYFNISHSGEYWCIVFSDSECGIDIETNRELGERMKGKILCPGETAIDGNLLKNWVLKEAYAKKTGVGIGISSGVATFSLEQIYKECLVLDISDDDYICFVVGADLVTDIVRLSWDGKTLQ